MFIRNYPTEKQGIETVWNPVHDFGVKTRWSKIECKFFQNNVNIMIIDMEYSVSRRVSVLFNLFQ